MALIDTLRKKVPEDIQYTPEFNTLRALIRSEDIRSAIGLRSYITSEIDRCQAELKKLSKGPETKNRLRVRCAKKLDFLKVIRTKVLRYL